MRHIQEQEKTQNFPGVPVDENPSANAGDTGLIPALGRFHMPQSKPMRHKHKLQLLKPIHLKPVLHKRSHHNEKLKHQTKRKPLLTATRERHAATKTQHSGGEKKNKKRQAQRITHRLRALLQYF